MTKDKQNKSNSNLPLLEESLQRCLKAIDNQIARVMQRSPAERELHGVQKWGPFSERIESITGFLVEEFADQNINIDSMLVLLQSLSKALSLITEELGQESLGNLRSEYCLKAFESVSYDILRVNSELKNNIE